MVLGLANLHQGSQRIAAHQLTGREMTLNKLRHRFTGDGRDLLHGDKPGTLVPVLNRHQHRGFALGTAASLSPAATTADQGIVDLDQIVQPIDAVPVSHGNADLAQHPAGRDPGNLDLFGETHGRNAALVRGSQVDRPEPLGQGQIGGVKQRSRRERGLVMALGAFAGMARGDDIAMIMPAAQATEPFRPALLRQRLGAGFFRSLPFLPVKQVGFRRFHDSAPYLVDLKAFGRKLKTGQRHVMEFRCLYLVSIAVLHVYAVTFTRVLLNKTEAASDSLNSRGESDKQARLGS